MEETVLLTYYFANTLAKKIHFFVVAKVRKNTYSCRVLAALINA